jgi:hypothetical protein
MREQAGPRDEGRERDLERVTQDITARLTTRGVEIRDDDSRDDVTAIADAVERFEQQVFALGGDLMVDEPPPGHRGRPDESRFRLPLRAADERAGQYVARLTKAADELRRHRRDA